MHVINDLPFAAWYIITYRPYPGTAYKFFDLSVFKTA
jgi:hypothetical protein